MAIMTCTTYSGENASSYDTLLSYLRDIDVGLPNFWKEILNDPEQLYEPGRFPLSLLNAEPVRNLVYNTEAVLKTDKWVYNMYGVCVTVSGKAVGNNLQPCTVGARRFGPTNYIAADEYKDDVKKNFAKSCNSCMYNGMMTRCELYQHL